MRFLRWARRLLEHPLQVLLLTTGFCLISLLFDGVLLNYWSLKSEKTRLESEYKKTVNENLILQKKVEQASHSEQFIGRQAREKLDLVGEDELVFIFQE